MPIVVPRPGRWTRQPPGVPRIHRGNPLGRKVLAAYLRGVDLVAGKRTATTGTFALAGSEVGQLESFDGSSYQDLGLLLDITRPVTIAYFLKAAAPPTYMGVAKLSGTTGSNAFIIIRSTDAAYRLSCGYTNVGAVPLFSGVSNSFDGVAERTVITCAAGIGSNGSADYIAWINGSSFGSVGGATFSNQANDNSYLGWDGVDSKTSGLLDEFIVFDGVLSDAEIAAYYRNPWQVFKRPSGFWMLPAAGGGASGPTGLATETDTALALAAVDIRPAGLATETDTALALSAPNGVGLATETDTALALAAVDVRAVGLVSEADSALALAAVQRAATGLAVETDTAFALFAVGPMPVGLAIETDFALALLPGGQPVPQGLGGGWDELIAGNKRRKKRRQADEQLDPVAAAVEAIPAPAPAPRRTTAAAAPPPSGPSADDYARRTKRRRDDETLMLL